MVDTSWKPPPPTNPPPPTLAWWGDAIDAEPFDVVYERATRQRGFVPAVLTRAQLECYCNEGYCIVDGFPPEMLQPLREAAARTIAKGRAAAWPNNRM
jgi:hypothetical protein